MIGKKPIRITKYRVDTWLNTITSEPLYGVSVKIEGLKGWVRVSNQRKAVILDTVVEAKAYIASMKAERDESGFKKEKSA